MTYRLWLRRIEEVPEGLLAEQRCTDDPQHIEGASVQPEVVLDDGDQAICDDGDIYLDADSILRCSPEGVDAEMRLYPFEETLDQPAIFIQESDGLGLEREVVGQERKRSFVLRGVVNDASESDGILAARLLSREPDGLVEDDITIVGKFLAGRNDLVLHPSLLADDELRRDEVNLVKSLKIIVSTVEDVVCEGFERNPVHSVDVRNLGISDIDIDRYLSRNVKKGMCFDARLRLPEIGPREQAQAEVDGRGVEREEPPVQFERSSITLPLGDTHHMICELFKYLVIPSGVGRRQVPNAEFRLAEPQMIALALVGMCDTYELPETAATGQLPVHRHHEMVPATVSLDVLVSAVLLDYAVEHPLGQQRGDLAEDIGSRIHYRPFGYGSPMIRNQIDTQKSAA